MTKVVLSLKLWLKLYQYNYSRFPRPFPTGIDETQGRVGGEGPSPCLTMETEESRAQMVMPKSQKADTVDWSPGPICPRPLLITHSPALTT